MEIYTGSGVRVFEGSEAEAYVWLQRYPQYLIPEWFIPINGSLTGRRDSVILFYQEKNRVVVEMDGDDEYEELLRRVLGNLVRDVKTRPLGEGVMEYDHVEAAITLIREARGV